MSRSNVIHPILWFHAILLLTFGCSPRLSNADSDLIKKYEQKLGTTISKPAKSIALYRHIDEWWGTPYKLGNLSKKGVDCSGFTFITYKEVYGKEIPRKSMDQFAASSKIPKRKLKEGNLVFFNIEEKNKVSHVGIYLKNGKFVHASTSKGVRIDSLGSDYYKKSFKKGGKFSP